MANLREGMIRLQRSLQKLGIEKKPGGGMLVAAFYVFLILPNCTNAGDDGATTPAAREL